MACWATTKQHYDKDINFKNVKDNEYSKKVLS